MKTNMKNSIFALTLAAFMSMPLVFAANEPENVSNVSATSKDATTLTVSWNAAKDFEGNAVDHYRVYYGIQSVQGGEASAYEIEVDTPDNKTTYDLVNLTTDTPYYLSVTAIDSNDVESLEYSVESSGTPTAEVVEAGDTAAPTVLNVIAMDNTHVLVGFSEEVKLPELLPEAAFTVSEQINPNNMLEVKSAEKYADDPENKTVILETAEQTKNLQYIVTASVAITDMEGNPIVSGSTDSGIFLASDKSTTTDGQEETSNEQSTVDQAAQDLLEQTPSEEVEGTNTANNTGTPLDDTTPPEEVTNFVLTFKEQLEKFVIMMNWAASPNTAKDLVDQMLYSSTDRGVTYDKGKALGGTATSYKMDNLEGGKEYTFKLTTKDSSGNESVGVVKSIRLPQTGFGAGILVFASVFGAKRVLRRKKKDVF